MKRSARQGHSFAPAADLRPFGLRKTRHAGGGKVSRKIISAASGRSGAFGAGPKSIFEPLEARQMLSTAYLSGVTLNVVGNSNAANDLTVGYSGDKKSLVVGLNGSTQSFDAGSVRRLQVNGGGAADRIVIAKDLDRDATVYGGAGNDLIYGGAGNDRLNGGTGDDTIAGGSGSDTIYGEDGNDVLDGQTDIDSLYGGNGYDYANSGFWRADLEAGFDGLPTDAPGGSGNSGGYSGGSSTAAVSLDGGVLKLTGADGRANTITVNYGGSGYTGTVNDQSATFAGGVNAVSVTGGNGNDTIKISQNVLLPGTIHGGAGDDLIEGGGGPDTIYGDGGNDVLWGGSGADVINGGPGNDSLDGGPDLDQLYGGGGSDRANSGFWRDGITSGWSGYTGNTGGTTPTPPPVTPPPTPPPVTPPATDPTGSVPSDNSGKAPTARIDAHDTSLMVGDAVFVQGLNSTLNAGSPLTARYEWDFGDAGSAYNTLVGFNASHVYDKPGTYTLTLRVFNEDRKSDTVTTTVKVAADNRRAIYVSNAGSDSNPGSWDRPIKSWDKAAALLGASDNVAVLFHAGETFDVRRSMVISGKDTLIGTYGTGAKPVLKWYGNGDRNTIIRSNPSAAKLTIQGLTFDSEYTSTNGEPKGLPFGVKLDGKDAVVRDSTFLNVNYAIQGSGAPQGVLLLDNDAPSMTGIRGYFAWVDGSDWTFLGNKVVNVTREHTVRISGGQRVNFHDNDLANADRRTVDRYDTSKGVITVQLGSYAYLSDNRIDGPLPIGPLGEADGLTTKGSRWRYAVVEDNVIDRSTVEVAHGAEHVMIRNNVIRVNNDQAIEVDGYNSQYGRGVVDVSILNNTAINNSTIGRFAWFSGVADGVNLENNLYVAPNLTIGAYHSAGVFINTSDLSGFNKIDHNVWPDPRILDYAQGGVNWVGGPGTGTEGFLTPAEWNALRVVVNDSFENVKLDGGQKPTTTDAAVGGGVPLAGVFTDINGKYRDPGKPWTVGAVQA